MIYIYAALCIGYLAFALYASLAGFVLRRRERRERVARTIAQAETIVYEARSKH